MEVFYRILSIDENESSIVVRYWTDQLSEKELSVDPNEENDQPTTCRTDYNLNIKADMSEAELHDFIVSCAPTNWFALKHDVKDPEVDTSFNQVKPLVGQTRSSTYEAPKPHRETLPKHIHVQSYNVMEDDITALLPYPDKITVNAGDRFYVYRVSKKTNDGPWTVPAPFTEIELGSVLMPFMKLLYSKCPGIIEKPTISFEASNVMVRRYVVDSLKNAMNLKNFLEKGNYPEQLAMRSLSKRYAEKAGTTYATSIRVTKDAT